MIRFIEVGNQVLDDERYFSWWDTITDGYLEFNGEQMWETWDDLLTDYLQGDDHRDPTVLVNMYEVEFIERLWGLYPRYRKDREDCGD